MMPRMRTRVLPLPSSIAEFTALGRPGGKNRSPVAGLKAVAGVFRNTFELLRECSTAWKVITR